ncbi:5-deoxy-glucuronate isomerase [Actinomyces sp. B33]|uniref:5-deoxy-glucuronate isomerase n=1 Tax=Actinomyces sp. B33 TaxID=2942131 RepID=UPI00233FA8C3|nr:5-deoxy-glucuronate isomerase [Actinomyces sp. B33]MDC4232488.1 5-deoxy-glucuronate isomerase [Actinomyces sp. B33]
MNDEKHAIRSGAAAHGPYRVDLDPRGCGWDWACLRVVQLAPGQSLALDADDTEYLVLPLTGSCTVLVNGADYSLAGRESVFTDITDSLYVPRRTPATLRSDHGGRFALPGSVATTDLPVRYCPRNEVVTGLRGSGPASRQVNNYALGNALKTSHLLACEVLTPGGNWSSYPPHKHDEHTDDERILEEIYYYEIRPGRDSHPGFALQRISPSPGHDIDVCTEVHDGDVIVMPHGYHGPTVAAPGYDLYYLNVMAGPAEEAIWLMTDDPRHAWVRSTWSDRDIDPRLPMTPMN